MADDWTPRTVTWSFVFRPRASLRTCIRTVEGEVPIAAERHAMWDTSPSWGALPTNTGQRCPELGTKAEA